MFSKMVLPQQMCLFCVFSPLLCFFAVFLPWCPWGISFHWITNSPFSDSKRGTRSHRRFLYGLMALNASFFNIGAYCLFTISWTWNPFRLWMCNHTVNQLIMPQSSEQQEDRVLCFYCCQGSVLNKNSFVSHWLGKHHMSESYVRAI